MPVGVEIQRGEDERKDGLDILAYQVDDVLVVPVV
jgi:hypothetical protein